MRKNMGSADKAIRLLLAAAFIILYITNIATGSLGYVLLVLAVIFILTSLVSFCPLYTLINANTCPAKDREVK